MKNSNNNAAVATTEADSRKELRQSIYGILILASVGLMLGRIMAVDSIDKIAIEKDRRKQVEGKVAAESERLVKLGVSGEKLQTALAEYEKKVIHNWATLRRPFLSGNDRSRWCTVRALVEDDMRVEGFPYAIDRVIEQPNWDTIDMVKHPGDGHFYSSKPTLLPTLMAAVYWPIYRFSGWTLGTHPYEIGRIFLVLFNVIPLWIALVFLSKLIDRFGTSDWGRIFAMAAACFATFLTTFAVAINNHVIAAVSVVFASYAAVRIWFDGCRQWRYFIIAGVFGAFAAVNELPAASFFALLALLLLMVSWRQTLLAFLPAALAIIGALEGTNWIAVHSLRPAYAHRSPGDDWYRFTYKDKATNKEKPSYWTDPQGIDLGEPSRGKYALHVFVGHHGIFSLTPVWLFSFIGLGIWLFRRGDTHIRWLSAAILLLSVVIIAFYLARPTIDRNYGGVTCGLRWLFWLAPLWILAMLPALDCLAARRWTRGLALLLLAASVLSASYPTWNPWTQPWISTFCQYMGWGT